MKRIGRRNAFQNATWMALVAMLAVESHAKGQVLLVERFDTGIPAGWTDVDDAGSGVVWSGDNPGGRDNDTGGSGGFAIIDSDLGGKNFVDASLMTPVMDLTGVTGAQIEFDTDFLPFSGFGDSTNEIADVDLSLSGGSPWANVWRRTEGDGPLQGLVQIPIPTADNQPLVRVRFRYYNAFYDFWWEVDDVVIAGVDPDRIFECDFENGTTSHWSSTAGGSLRRPGSGERAGKHAHHHRAKQPRAAQRGARTR